MSDDDTVLESRYNFRELPHRLPSNRTVAVQTDELRTAIGNMGKAEFYKDCPKFSGFKDKNTIYNHFVIIEHRFDIFDIKDTDKLVMA